MKEPTVSILMAVHNAGKYLKPAVESILGQGFGDFEFLVVDDASRDGSGEVLEDYARRDTRLRLCHNQTNQGLTRCLESLMDDIKGEFVARMDADDLSLPGRFQAQVDRFRRDPHLGVLGTWVRKVLEDGTPVEEVRYPDDHDWIVRFLETGNCYTHGSVMFRQTCLQTLGRPLWRLRYGQDYDLFVRLLDFARFGFLEEVYYVRRLHDTAICSTISPSLRAFYHGTIKQLRILRQQGLPEFDWRSREIEVLSATDPQECEHGHQLQAYARALLELRLGNAVKARGLLRQCLPNPHLRTKSYILLFFSRLPLFLRRLVLTAMNWLRRIRHPEERFIHWHTGGVP